MVLDCMGQQCRALRCVQKGKSRCKLNIPNIFSVHKTPSAKCCSCCCHCRWHYSANTWSENVGCCWGWYHSSSFWFRFDIKPTAEVHQLLISKRYVVSLRNIKTWGAAFSFDVLDVFVQVRNRSNNPMYGLTSTDHAVCLCSCFSAGGEGRGERRGGGRLPPKFTKPHCVANFWVKNCMLLSCRRCSHPCLCQATLILYFSWCWTLCTTL